MENKISILKTKSNPSIKDIKDIILLLIKYIDGLEKRIDKNAKILIKPNIGVVSSPHSGINSDPRVVSAVIEILKDYGIKKIIIGESSVVGTDTILAYKASGLQEILEYYDVELIDLKKEKYTVKKVKDHLVLPEINIYEIVDKVDSIINIPKLKTICACQVSLSLKNLKGLIPDFEKKRFHHTKLQEAIVDLNKVIPTSLTIVDGIISSELYNPKETNILIAGFNNLAVDAVASKIIGINPEDIEYFKLAEKEGLGILNIDDLSIMGENIDNINFNFLKAPDTTQSYRILFPEVEIIDNDACTGCIASLYRTLDRLKNNGLIKKIEGYKIFIGLNRNIINTNDKVLYLGNCALNKENLSKIKGCPFTSIEAIDFIEDKI